MYAGTQYALFAINRIHIYSKVLKLTVIEAHTQQYKHYISMSFGYVSYNSLKK